MTAPASPPVAGVDRIGVYEAVCEWIRNDVGLGVQMGLTPDATKKLVARIEALASPVGGDGSSADCFECSAPLVGPFCPECNPAIKQALGYPIDETEAEAIAAWNRRAVPMEAVAWREKVEIVTEWLAMAKEAPKPLHSSLNYVPIGPSEFDAIEAILQALAVIPAPGKEEVER